MFFQKKYHYIFNVAKDYNGDKVIYFKILSLSFVFWENCYNYKTYMENVKEVNFFKDLKKLKIERDENMEGLKRLEQEVVEMNNFSIYNIFNHIKDLPDLQNKFDNEEKTIKGMYRYLYSKAENIKQDKVAMVHDKIVYSWATNYFKLSNKELGIEEKKVMPPSTDEVIKKIESNREKQKSEQERNSQISFFSEVE